MAQVNFPNYPKSPADIRSSESGKTAPWRGALRAGLGKRCEDSTELVTEPGPEGTPPGSSLAVTGRSFATETIAIPEGKLQGIIRTNT
jgi:hypothetical protein